MRNGIVALLVGGAILATLNPLENRALAQSDISGTVSATGHYTLSRPDSSESLYFDGSYRSIGKNDNLKKCIGFPKDVERAAQKSDLHVLAKFDEGVYLNESFYRFGIMVTVQENAVALLFDKEKSEYVALVRGNVPKEQIETAARGINRELIKICKPELRLR